MSQKIPTNGNNPAISNREAWFSRKLEQAAGKIRIVNEAGRIPRRRKKIVHRVERLAYKDLLLSVSAALAERARAARS